MATSTAFVPAGGGSIGAVQVGMLRELLEHGVEPGLERAAVQIRRWLDEGGLGKQRIPGALRPHQDQGGST